MNQVPHSLLQLIRQAPLACFFVLAFAFTWSLLPLAATSIPVSLVALCGPAVAAVIVTALEGGECHREFLARLTHWRMPLRWLLLALVLPLLISTVKSAVEYVRGAYGTIEFQPVTILSLIVFVLVAGEEVGWRGLALPRLLPHYGPWRASMIVGIIWAFWHLPLFYMPSMPQYGTPFPAFIIYTSALSIILTVLASKSRDSVIMATVFHGAVNTMGVVNTAADSTLRGWSNAACYGIAALLLGLMTWKTGRQGIQHDDCRS